MITRLLADETFYGVALGMYEVPELLTCCDDFMQTAFPEWKCWQSGVELKYLGVTLLRLKEAGWENPNTLCDYRQCQLVIKSEQATSWSPLNVSTTSILEILIPNESLTVQFETGGPVGMSAGRVYRDMSECVTVQPSAQVIASLLTKIVEHIDTLLEDWYPDIGARFVQNSKGMYLISRIVPCSRCLIHQMALQAARLNNADAWAMVEVDEDSAPQITEPVVIEGGGRVNGVGTAVGSADTDRQIQCESAPVGGAMR